MNNSQPSEKVANDGRDRLDTFGDRAPMSIMCNLEFKEKLLNHAHLKGLALTAIATQLITNGIRNEVLIPQGYEDATQVGKLTQAMVRMPVDVKKDLKTFCKRHHYTAKEYVLFLLVSYAKKEQII